MTAPTLAWTKYGVPPAQPAPVAIPSVAPSNGAVVTGRSTSKGRTLSVGSMEMWLFGIGAVTLGLVYVTTTVRVGPVHAELDL